MVIDWAALRAGAAQMAQQAYAPYSRLRVGAAALTADGRIIHGCNVENASYGLTLCAECGLVSALHAAGGGTLAAVSVVSGEGQRLLPCGRCRQLLLEAGGPGLLVDTDDGPAELSRLLPAAFTATDLPPTDLPPAGLPPPSRPAGPPAASRPATDLRASDLAPGDGPGG